MQGKLFEGGFAGITYPREYGGLGLSEAHQAAFDEESAGYEMPTMLGTPNFSICAMTILDMASEELKREHLPRVIRGEEVLLQFLSESRGGSDLAGVTTRATRDGDVFILNGEKIWSTGAFAADYALCLARTDWDAPKHRGVTMLLVKVHQPGISVRRIKQTNGHADFCQEFFDDVEIPVGNVVGEVNGGWAVATRLLYHERKATGHASAAAEPRVHARQMLALAQRNDTAGDPHIRRCVGELYMLDRLTMALSERVATGMAAEALSPAAGAVARLFSGESVARRSELDTEIAGIAGIIDDRSDRTELTIGDAFLFRQALCVAGGSLEMARNVISERILGMPREYAADRDLPFSQVRQGR